MQKFMEVEKKYLIDVLKHTQGSVTMAARVSGISRSTFYKKLITHFGKGFIQTWKPTAVMDNNTVVFVPR